MDENASVPHSRSVVMINPDLSTTPVYPLPDDCSVRWYTPGAERDWEAIHRDADHYGTVTPELFRQQFGSSAAELSHRQCYLAHSRHGTIGTATAWYADDFLGGSYGRVHWVAIITAMQGRGLAKPLLSIVCRRLLELGHHRAYLTTATVRIAAINLYLRFGFRPYPRDRDEADAWQQLAPRLKFACPLPPPPEPQPE